MPAIANPCCCPRCVVFRDRFADHSPGVKNGPISPGDWYASPDLSTYGTGHGAWQVTYPGAVDDASLYWAKVDNSYELIDGSGRPFRLYYRGEVPRHFSASVDMRPTFPDSIGSITYAPVTAITDDAKWYRLEVVASGSTYGDTDAATACGYLRIRRLITDTTILIEVPIPGLCAMGKDTDSVRFMHRARLCYNPDTRILSGSVTTHLGETHWVHVKNIEPVAEHSSNFSTVTGFGNTNLWFELTNWGTRPTDYGSYIFDNFTLATTKNTPEDFGYGYGYGYDESEDCPCCGGCTIAGFYFNDPANDGLSASEADCRILQSGTAVQSGGALSASSNTTLTWLGSHSGVGNNCLPSAAQSVTASINSAEYGKQITVSIGSVEATLTVESSEGAGDGTLSLSGVDPVTVPDATIDTLLALRLCVNADTLIASAGGKVLLRVLSDPPADSPVAIALDAGTILYGFDIDFGCSEDCTPDEADPPNDCEWCDGETVPTVLAFRPHIPSDTTGLPDCNFCDMINDRTFIMKYNLGCVYAQEGGLHAPMSEEDPCDWLPGCDASPDSLQICLATALNFSYDEITGHLIATGSVVVFSNWFTCVIRFEQDFGDQFGPDNHPDCESFFSGVVRLPFKEFAGGVDGGPCRLCGTAESGPTDTSTWYLEVVGL